MNRSTDPPATDRPPGRPLVIAPAILWLMRLLALAAAGVAAYLLWLHVSGQLARGASAVPLCGGGSWLDCASVLNSRWAAWFGVPVAAPALVLYLTMAAALGLVGPRRRDIVARACWAWLLFGGAAALGAAAWFVYVQAALVERWCLFCLFEHALGAMLGGLVILFGLTCLTRRAAAASLLVGLLAAAALAAGQRFNPPRYAEPVEWSVEGERYVEPTADPDGGLALLHGRIVLDPAAHPRLGRPDATRHFVEIIDFTCFRCAEKAPLIRGALERLGPDAAALVVFSPLNPDCNPHVPRLNPAYEHACGIARIAAAAWLADRDAYAEIHRWLLANREGMTPDKARRYAAQRVGRADLDRAMADERVDTLIARDVALTAKLDLRGMPGLIAGDTRFRALPEDPAELARLLAKAWRDADGGAASPVTSDDPGPRRSADP